MDAVLDASALLAYFLDEAGAGVVEDAVARGAAISTINLSECLTKLVDVKPDLSSSLESSIRTLGSPWATTPASRLAGVWPPACSPPTRYGWNWARALSG